MPPKRFEGKFGIPPSKTVESELTSALYRLPDSISLEYIENLTNEIVGKVNKQLIENYEESMNVAEDSSTSNRGSRSLTEAQIKILHLKLARHFEDNGNSAIIDVPTCVDAIVESPKFLDSIKGSMEKLFEMHEMKTIQKIAELRHKRAEMTGDEKNNPYENLFETTSGKYYMARLLNMPHLERESEYMDHCVGTSTSYVNKIKRGEVEILSFRDKITDNPIATIEYDLKSRRLLQIKLFKDKLPKLSDSFSADLLEAIEMLGTTKNDLESPRKVEGTLLKDMKTLLSLQEKSKKQEKYTRDELLFLYEVNSQIQCFDKGRDPLVDELLLKRNRKEDIKTMCNCEPQFIAHDFIDINEQTQVFCEDTGKKIIFFDFRTEANQKKFPQLIELAKKIKESGSGARPDMSFECGIVHLEIDKELQEKLKTWNGAKEAFTKADTTPSDFYYDEFSKIYSEPITSKLDIIVIDHKSTELQERDKLVEDMDKVGYRPLEFSELVTLGIIKPEFNKRNNVILYTCQKYDLLSFLRSPFLIWGGRWRRIDADDGSTEWGDGVRFVFVRK